jgi:gliding motility-associated-like protein
MISLSKPSKSFLKFSFLLLFQFFIFPNLQAQHQEPIVIDVFPGFNNSSNPDELTAVGDKLIFNATGSGVGKEPHISDGTIGNTNILLDIFASSNSSSAKYFTEFSTGGQTYAYYFANDGVNSGALYRTNMATANTEFVVNVNPTGSASSTPGAGNGEFLVNVNGTLFFAGQDPIGRQELFKSDGTAGGTVLVKDINTTSVGGFTIPSNPENLTNINGTLFFTADADFDGGANPINRELWISDGTDAGTRMVLDINPGGSSSPSNLVEKDGLCYFLADDGTGTALWRSDGTAGNTVKITMPAGTTVDANGGLVNSNNILFFAANNAAVGNELWSSDGSTVTLVKDIFPGTSSSNPTNFTDVGGTCYFSAIGETTGAELWKSNNTGPGTVLVKDIQTGTFGSTPRNLTAVRGLVNGVTTTILYFTAFRADIGEELFKSNGTDAGTVLVKDINTTSTGSTTTKLSGLTAVRVKPDKDGLFFAAYDGDDNIGTELWYAKPCPTATLTYNTASICKNAGCVLPTLTGEDGEDVSGGTYTISPTGLPIDASTGELCPNAGVTSGFYTITYKVTKGICDIETKYDIEVVDGGSSSSLQVSSYTTGFNFDAGSSNTGNEATSDGTSGMVKSADGLYLFVSDERNHVIKKIDVSDSTVSIVAGTSGSSGFVDASGASARFNQPAGLAIDDAGNLYVADKNNHSIRKIVDPTAASPAVSTIAGTTSAGNVTGTIATARFNEPSGVAVDFSGNIYVADKNNHRIKKIANGNVTTLAGPTADVVVFPDFTNGQIDGAGNIARFYFPTDLAIDFSGNNLYVADRHNNIIRQVSTSDGATSTFAGSISSTTAGYQDGASASARFNHPTGIAVDIEGNVYVADTRNQVIRKVSGGQVTTIAGGASSSGLVNGLAPGSRFNYPGGIYADLEQNIFISDKVNQAVRRYFISNPSGSVSVGKAVCAGDAGNLNLTGTTGTVTKWESSTDGVNWTEVASSAGLTTLPYSNLSANTFFRAFVQNGACAAEASNYAVLLIGGPNAPTSGGDQSRCGTGTVTLTATGTSDGSYVWYDQNDAEVGGQVNSSFTTGSLAAGTYTFNVAIKGASCESAKVPIQVTVNADPAPVVAGANTACPTQTETYTTTNNAGNTYNWEVTNGTITGGQGTASVTIEWGTPGAATVKVTETTPDGCTFTTNDYAVTINGSSADPAVTNGSNCGTGTVNLSASGATLGSMKYRWYDAATGGTMLKESTNNTDGNFTTPSISTTTSYYVSIINGTCESGRVEVVATIFSGTPADPTVAATPDTRCGAGNADFTASGAAVSGETYRWYDAATGGNMLQDDASPNFSIGVTATTTYYVSIHNTSCGGESGRVPVTITVTNSGGTPPNVTSQSRCGTGDIVLTAAKADASAPAAGEEFRWYDAATSGTLLESNTGSFTITNLSTTTSYYVSFFNGSCETDRVEVTATIEQLPSPTTLDGSRCETGTVELTANGAVAGQVYKWYLDASTSSHLKLSADENDNTYTTPSLTSTRDFYVAIAKSDGSCEGARVRITATINGAGTPPAAPTVVVIPTARCGAGTFVLDASGATGGQVYKWYDSDQTTLLKTSTDQQDTTFTTPSVTASKSFYVSVLDASCGNAESTLTKVDVTVSAGLANPVATAGSSCGAGTVTLSATGGVDGQYRWYDSPTSTTDLGQNSSFTTPSLTATTTYYVSLFNGTCETDRVPVVATISDAPVPTISGTSLACTGTTVTYNAGSTGNTYVWAVTGGTIQSGAGTASITVDWGVGSVGSITLDESIGGCTAQIVKNISIKPVPTPALVGVTGNCIAEQTTYSTANVAGNTYTWTVTGGTVASGQGSNSITVTWGTSGAKTVSVEEDNGACKITASANVNPTPVITGATTACQNVAGTIYSTPNNAGNTYNWVITGGTIDSGTGTNQISVTWTDATAGTLTLTETDPLACNTTTAVFNVSIFAKPAAPTVTGDMNICAFTTGTSYEATYTITAPDANYIYSWSIVNSSDGQIVSTNTADSTEIKIRWSNNLPFSGLDVADVKFRVLAKIKSTNCSGDFTEQTVTVKRTPVKPQLTDNTDSVYVNNIRTYSLTTNNTGSTYAWTVNGGTIQSGAGTNQITVKWGAAGTGEVFAKEIVTNTSCENFSDTARVNIFPYSITASALSPQICEGGQVRLKGVDANATTFEWYDAATGGTKLGESTNSGASSDTLRITQNTLGSFIYYVTPVTSSGARGADDSAGDNARIPVAFDVVVNDPSNFTIVGDTTNAQNCTPTGAGGGAVTLTTVSGGFGGAPYTYLWTKTGDGAYSATTKDITNLTPGTYNVQVTDAGGCASNVISFLIEDNRQYVTDAKITPTSSGSLLVNAVGDTATITVGESVILAATATDAATFAWTADTDADVANIGDAASGTPTMTPKQTTRYSVLLTNNKGCDTTVSVVVRVLSFQVFVPTMFTPNNDQKNDLFQVFGNQVETLEIKVYNREGKLVYESKDKAEFLGSDDFGIKTSETQTRGWDGTFEEKPLPKGNYVWYLTGKFKNGVEIKKSGNVLLVR